MKIADPMKNPILILGVALLLGVLQIIFGIFIKIYSKIKNKMLKEALLDDFPWIYFIFSLLIFGAKDFFNLPQNFSIFLILSAAIAMVLTQGRKTKNILLKPFSGVLSLYGIIGYLSDALSYSRLLALCLATSVIASVVNLTAGIFKEMIPIVGLFFAFLILLFGHIFNIFISSLGAFIHSMRLQFVEFIPKFMEGGGKRFKPFLRESKYVEVIS
jgi:V/A-type H+-transporting ATPase subunit I